MREDYSYPHKRNRLWRTDVYILDMSKRCATVRHVSYARWPSPFQLLVTSFMTKRSVRIGANLSGPISVLGASLERRLCCSDVVGFFSIVMYLKIK